jgi:hypothetical protein
LAGEEFPSMQDYFPGGDKRRRYLKKEFDPSYEK